MVPHRCRALVGPPSGSTEPLYAEEEAQETHSSLREKQVKMEQRVIRIWTVLSTYKVSSARCLYDTRRHASNGAHLEAIRVSERLILHVEVLFGAIEDAEWHSAQLNMKGASFVRKAYRLYHSTLDFLMLWARAHQTSSRGPEWMGISQELLREAWIQSTILIHCLIDLINIALRNTLKLERDYGVQEAVKTFLDKLHLLTCQEADPSVRRMVKRANDDVITTCFTSGNPSTAGVMYGFSSLSPEYAGESPFITGPRDPVLSLIPVPNPPSELCITCNSEIKGDCVRLGIYERWHSGCVQCKVCGKVAARQVDTHTNYEAEDKTKEAKKGDPKGPRSRLIPAHVDFVYELDSAVYTNAKSIGVVPNVFYCADHARQGCRGGFKAVSCLEQYAFLLNVALRRLFLVLNRRGVIMLTPASPGMCPWYFTAICDTHIASHVCSNDPFVSLRRAGSWP